MWQIKSEFPDPAWGEGCDDDDAATGAAMRSKMPRTNAKMIGNDLRLDRIEGMSGNVESVNMQCYLALRDFATKLFPFVVYEAVVS